MLSSVDRCKLKGRATSTCVPADLHASSHVRHTGKAQRSKQPQTLAASPRAGTADAVRQYMWLFEEAVNDGVEDFLILSGDHLYRCNYQDFVREHRETGADITVAALPCDPQRASAFGLMKIDGSGKIGSFAEKPTGDALKAMEVDTTVLGLSADKAKVRCCP